MISFKKIKIILQKNKSKTKHGLNVVLSHKGVSVKMSVASDLAISRIPHCNGKDELFQGFCNHPLLGTSKLGALGEGLDPGVRDLGNGGNTHCSVSTLRSTPCF